MKVAVLPGDGIGREIVAEAKKVLRCLALPLEMQEAPVGGAGYEAAGDPLPEPTLGLARDADAILFGAIGGPRYDALPRDKRPERGLLRLRKELGLFANLRPALVYEELAQASTLKSEIVSGLDILIVRELTGDIYFGEPRGISKLPSGEREGVNTMRYRESEIRRIARKEAVLGRQGERARGHRTVEAGGDRGGYRLPRRRALAHVRGQLRHAAGAQPEAVRRDRHREHVRRHPVGRSIDADRIDRHAALGLHG
jgi:isocitrate/isopropylmalate dehydrogenase